LALAAILTLLAIPALAQQAPAQQAPAQQSLAPQASAQPVAATFDLARDRQPLVALDGQWRFHPGNNPAWANPAFDDSQWSLLRGDESWTTQGYPAMSGYAWYRFNLQLPANSPPSSILFAPIYTSYEVYLDGQLAGGGGKMPPVIAPYAMFQFHTFPLPAAGPQPRTVHVALRVWHSAIWASYIGGGPSRSGSLFGETRLIQSELRHRFTVHKVIFEDAYVYSLVAALVGCTILGLFFFRPREHEYLWFAVLLLSGAADQAIQVVYNVFSLIPVPIFDLMDGYLVAINQAAALAFFSIVLRARRDTLWRIALAVALISPWMNILYWPNWLSAAGGAALQWVCLLPSSLWILVVLVRRALRRDPDALLLAIPTVLYCGFFFLYSLALLLSQASWIVMPDILLEPLPLPPFTMHWQIVTNLIFLAALLAFLIRRFTKALQGEERYAGQLEAARQVQQVLLPEDIPQAPGFAIDCIYQPAEEVGGDFFQILPAPHGALLVVVGDVAGKGLPAAMMVSVMVGCIRTEAAHTADPAEMLASLNERTVGRCHGGFTTCLCLHIAADGLVTLASAGHLSPYLDGAEIPLHPALPLGILAGLTYGTSTLQLQPSQRLTLVSDGVLEAQSRHGELFGFDRTRELSTQPAAQIAQTAQNFGQNDDITIVTLQFQGKPAELLAEPAIQTQAIR
jgi:hypothetical protein